MSKKVRKIANRSLRLSRIEPKTQVFSLLGAGDHAAVVIG